MNESTQRKTGAILSYVTIIVNTLIQLLYTPLLIRKLGQSEYGLYSLVSSIIGYLTILDLGFGNAIIVYTSKYRVQGKKEEEKKLHGMFKIIFIVIGVVAAILGLILYFNVDIIFGKTMTTKEIDKTKIMMLILVFNLMITFSFSIYNSIISAYEKFIFQKVMALINSIMKPLLMIPLLFMGYKSITMCIVITVINIIILLSNYFYCKKRLKISTKYSGFDKVLFKTILGYSIWIFLCVVVDKVNWSLDNFILGAISGTTAVSIYSIAATLNTLFINLSIAISGVLLPKISKMVEKKASTEELTKEMIKVGRLQFIVIFLATSGLILVGKEFIVFWAGKGFEKSYYVALLLIVPALFSLIQNLGLSIMQAMNKFRFKALATFIMSGFNLIISIYLARIYGAIGAALGTTIAIVVCNIIIMNIYYYKSLKLNVILFWKNISLMMIKYSIPIVLILLLMFLTDFKGITSVIIYGGIYTILYMIVTYYFVINDYEKRLIMSLASKLKIVRK